MREGLRAKERSKRNSLAVLENFFLQACTKEKERGRRKMEMKKNFSRRVEEIPHAREIPLRKRNGAAAEEKKEKEREVSHEMVRKIGWRGAE